MSQMTHGFLPAATTHIQGQALTGRTVPPHRSERPAGLPEEADNERETEGASVESEQSSGHPPPQQKLRLIGCLSFDEGLCRSASPPASWLTRGGR